MFLSKSRGHDLAASYNGWPNSAGQSWPLWYYRVLKKKKKKLTKQTN